MANWVPAILSVIETCRLLNVAIREYLPTVLPGPVDFTANRVSELMHASWTHRQSR